MVVIDKLSKSAHFIPIKSTFKAINIVEIFMKEIFRLHGISKMVISDRDIKFTSSFWKELFAGINTNFNFSMSYHPKMDGQTERTNQIIEDMLRMYVRTKLNKWEDYLHLVEFAYNNGYQTLAKLSPFEILYGKKCTTPISWDNSTDILMVGLDTLQEMENMVKKMAPRFCGLFEILARIGPVAYQLALPANLRIHNVFHVSLLKKYIHDLTHMINWNLVWVEPEGEFQVEPQCILD
jgi:hypothetical protein